jgi:hypothetical protein
MVEEKLLSCERMCVQVERSDEMNKKLFPTQDSDNEEEEREREKKDKRSIFSPFSLYYEYLIQIKVLLLSEIAIFVRNFLLFRAKFVPIIEAS